MAGCSASVAGKKIPVTGRKIRGGEWKFDNCGRRTTRSLSLLSPPPPAATHNSHILNTGGVYANQTSSLSRGHANIDGPKIGGSHNIFIVTPFIKDPVQTEILPPGILEITVDEDGSSNLGGRVAKKIIGHPLAHTLNSQGPSLAYTSRRSNLSIPMKEKNVLLDPIKIFSHTGKLVVRHSRRGQVGRR